MVKAMKQTEIGLIPEDWEVKDLNSISSLFKSGLGITSEDIYEHGTYPVYGGNGLRGYTNCYSHEDNLLLIGRQGALCGNLNYVEGKVYVSEHAIAVKATHSNKTKFFYYAFERLNLNSLSESSAQPGLSVEKLLKLQIPLPPLPEQEAIANALSDADVWIESLEQLTAKKRLIKHGALQTLLTPPNGTVSGVEAWEVMKLGEVGKTYGGLSGKSKKDFGVGNAHYIPFMNVMKNVVIDNNYIEKVSFKNGESQNNIVNGDLLFNGSSETPEELGISSVYLGNDNNLYLNSFCFGFRLFSKSVNALYLSYLFRSPYGRSVIFHLAQGATRYNLSKSNFLELEISMHKSLSEQTRIATILSDMDAEIEALEAQLDKARQLKQGMMQELLTGRVRLV